HNGRNRPRNQRPRALGSSSKLVKAAVYRADQEVADPTRAPDAGRRLFPLAPQYLPAIAHVGRWHPQGVQSVGDRDARSPLVAGEPIDKTDHASFGDAGPREPILANDESGI